MFTILRRSQQLHALAGAQFGLLTAAITLVVGGCAWAQPANDNLVNAQVISGGNGTVSGSNVNATGEVGEPNHFLNRTPTRSVWYRWVAPSSGLVTFATQGSSFDTIMAAYRGAAYGTLTRLDDDDDNGEGSSSLVSFNAVVGTTYVIAVDGFNSLEQGSVVLTWTNGASLARLANISTRAHVGVGEQTAIGGFILSGIGAKTVLIRGIGPSMAAAGVAGTLQNPAITLYSGQTAIAANDNWADHPTNGRIDPTLRPTNNLESAILATLAPGPYTVFLHGVGGRTGVGLIEIYETNDGNPNARLANLSTRANVQTGERIAIGGFIITGSEAKNVVIRGIGPSLANFGIGSPLQNPLLTLYSGQTAISVNDNWEQFPTPIPANLRPTNPLEAAMYVRLAPGAYTVFLEGIAGGTGTGLVEIFESD